MGPSPPFTRHVSSAPPKIPYSGFSPVRLQAKVCCHQPGPSRRATELKCQVHVPSVTARFDLAFVAYVPPADYRWHYQPARSGSLSSDHLGPRALRSERFIMPAHLRSYGPMRQSRPHPLTSPHRLIQEAAPDDLVWAANDTFPALGQHSFHACGHLYAGRRSRAISPLGPCSQWPSSHNHGVGSPKPRHRLPSG